VINCANLFEIKLVTSDLNSFYQYFLWKSEKSDEDISELPQRMKPSVNSRSSIEGLPESITLASGGYFTKPKDKKLKTQRYDQGFNFSSQPRLTQSKSFGGDNLFQNLPQLL
jgi:hypothetical protein